MLTSLHQSYSNFVKNSERYNLENYNNDAPDIDINNLSVNIETFSKILDIIEYWNPYEPYPNEVNIFFIELLKNKNNHENIKKYFNLRFNNFNKIQEYYYNFLSNFANYIIGKYVSNIELTNYVLDNNILNNDELLYGAIVHGYIEVVTYLLSLSPVIGLYNYDKALQLAAKNGRLKIVKYLLSLPIPIDIRNNEDNALMSAVYNGHLEVIEYLYPLHLSTSPKVNINRALKWAAENGHLEVVKFFADKGANISLISEAKYF